jgi:hypothetical protein
MGVLMTTGSLWPQMTHYSLLHPIPAPKRTTTQRVVVGWSDGGGEEGSQKPEQRWRRCIGGAKYELRTALSLLSIKFSP